MGCLPIGPVNVDISDHGHGVSKNRNPEEFFLGQPPKLDRKVSLKHHDIEHALVIGHVYIRCTGIDMIKSFNSYFNLADKKDRFGPEPSHQVGHVATL